MYQQLKYISILIIFLQFTTSCGKGYLEKKSDKSIYVPTTLEDFRALFSNRNLLDGTSTELGTMGADEYYLQDANWKSIPIYDIYKKNSYIWADDLYDGRQVDDWDRAYMNILYANLILYYVDKVDKTKNPWLFNHVKGGAYFFRGYRYYQLAQTFCKQYDATTAEQDLGLPLRIEYDPEVLAPRSNLKQVYDRIIADLTNATELLDDKDEIAFYEPGRAAAHFMLAKTYLQMGNYEKVIAHTNKVLEKHHKLLDYNTLNTSLPIPFPTLLDVSRDRSLNPEIIFQRVMHGPNSGASQLLFHPSRAEIDTNLLNSYAANDLRKAAFFGPFASNPSRTVFKGFYTGVSTVAAAFFAGIATDEAYLMRAEAYARVNETTLAMQDINFLAKHRYDEASFTPFIANTPEDALDLAIAEKRKELVFRGNRWEDLRRLNKEPQYATTLVREVDGNSYELKPGSLKWVWPLPDSEIMLTGMPQNPR